MIKRGYLVLFLLVLCVGCNSIDKPKKPDNLISEDKMVDILFDVFVFNAAKGTDKRVLEENNVTPTIYIYDKYQIDSMQFVKSNEYYAYDIKTYEELMERVQGRLKAKREGFEREINSEEDRRKKRLDSIKRIGDTLKTEKKPKSFKQN